MSKKIATVLIALWKAGPYLRAKISDIKQQTIFNDCNIVLLNCQNLDNESDIYKDFVNNNENVTEILYDQHINLYRSWNDGIKSTESEFIMNSNVDDMLHPRYIEKCSEWLKENSEFACVSSSVLLTNTPNQVYPVWTWNHKFPFYTYPLSTAGPCPLWRRSLHDKYGYFGDYRVIGDAKMWEQWYAGGEKFGLISDDMVLYYAHHNSLERRHDDNGILLRDLDLEEQ